MAIEQYIADSTRSWAEAFRTNGMLKPSILVRYATDQNYIRASDNVVMNLSLPGTRLPNIMQWQVTEASNQLVQQATLTCLNCMLVSVTSTTIATGSSISGNVHTGTIVAQWTQALGDDFNIVEHDGNVNIASIYSTGVPSGSNLPGFYYTQQEVLYVMCAHETFTVTDASGFPNPAICIDDDNDIADFTVAEETLYPAASGGVGAYFILVDDEIIRVIAQSGGTFSIPSGGRGIAGTAIVPHSAGAPVTLLNFGPYTGDWVGAGYLNVDDYSPTTSLGRPGTCFVTYEGYGDFQLRSGQSGMSHDVDFGSNYCFTGYWFVTGIDAALQEDGTPTMQFTVSSAGHMIDAQQISPVLLTRMGSQASQWTSGNAGGGTANQAQWGLDGYERGIPNQWVNFASWDPTSEYSYPLTISTLFAQNQDFLNHIQQSNYGSQCLVCRQEYADYVATHQGDGLNLNSQALNSLSGFTGDPYEVDQENRVIGKHIYTESICVLTKDGGPIITFIGLMAALAMASWDNPALATPLAQLFTKIPNRLYDACQNIYSGLCFNGQLSIDLDDSQYSPNITSDPVDNLTSNTGTNSTFDWWTPGYNSEFVISRRDPLLCPFTAQYDQVSFDQPMQDLATVNCASLWFSREGYPVFVPQFFSFRPSGYGYKTVAAANAHDSSQVLPNPFGASSGPIPGAEWHLSYGGSITEYDHSIATDQIYTTAYVTANGAFDGSSMQVQGSGTGLVNGKRVMYSQLGGNADGLALTGGVTQSTTVSMDNIVLGLSWDTQPAGWGVQEQFSGGGGVAPAPTEYGGDNNNNFFILNGKPTLYDGAVPLGAGCPANTAYSKQIEQIQNAINFFQVHRYTNPEITYDSSGNPTFSIGISQNGIWDATCTQGLILVQNLMNLSPSTPNTEGMSGQIAYDDNGNPTGGTWTSGMVINDIGIWDRKTFCAVNAWLTQNAFWINTDIWYYTWNGYSWNQYVAAVCGVPVTFQNDQVDSTIGTYAIDDTGTQQMVTNWLQGTGPYLGQTTFAKQLTNIADMTVDASVNNATVRSITCNIADPRIIPGDTIWCSIPGYLATPDIPPYSNGIYVTQVTRSADYLQGTYTATYSGTRYVADHNVAYQTQAINGAYDFIGQVAGT